ncbi:MAG: ABC transporter permease [Candidatus Bathyarchaeota archaeon]|nr:ABC transporter permease [Candidatus Bathyarchaeota archaeon]
MTFSDSLVKALYIARKDIRVYYLKAPNFTYGLLMPVALYLAFGSTGQLSPETLISGLVSLVILFGTTSIEAVSVVTEKTTGTLERLLAAPVSLTSLLMGKALAGFALGPVTAVLALIPITLLSGASIANPLLVFAAITVSSFTFAALGILVSVYAKWIPEAQMYSNFLRFPMAFLGGAFLPYSSMPPILQTVSRALPLTYTIEAMKEAMSSPFVTQTYLIDMVVLVVFSVVFMAAASRTLAKRLG